MSAHSATDLIVDGTGLEPPAGLRVRNFGDPEVHGFRGRNRSGRAVTELIIHESVTRSSASTVAVLRRRKLGVHLIVGPDGRVTQHGDLATSRLAHAGGHNGPSVGLEVVTPYYPKLTRDGLPWQRAIDARWAHRGRYLLPTPEQAETTARLVAWITSPNSVGLSIPRTWIGLDGERLALRRVPGAERRRPGVYAHHYFAHADGAWLVLYSWLRLQAGLAPCVAYEEAASRARGRRRHVDLSDFLSEGVA